ncbi:hypothetical protein VNO77_00586 [Canavalia gladiata]|uniref:Uncharacterized protein n=1 Tax=Canavalia gladiata TaxID=3824 RepID=A0AAN9MUG9_CANGL
MQNSFQSFVEYNTWVERLIRGLRLNIRIVIKASKPIFQLFPKLIPLHLSKPNKFTSLFEQPSDPAISISITHQLGW